MSIFEKEGTVMGSRAVGMEMEQGQLYDCDAEMCDDKIKFMSRAMARRSLHESGVVVCNVYEGDRWDRIESFHPDCYANIGLPFGKILDKAPTEPVIPQIQ